MSKINILHIHTLPIISGSGINTFLSMKGMEKHIYDTELVCAPGGRLIDLVRENQMKVWTFKNLVQPLDPVNDFLALLKISRFLNRKKYHIVHTHNSKAGFIGRLAAKIARVPVIIHTVHGFSFHDQEPLLKRLLFKYLEQMASHWCDRAIFISQPLIEWALNERIISRHKINKIYSGIDLDIFVPPDAERINTLRRKWSIGETDAVVGIVSKLWEGKGHSVLIDAFKMLKKSVPKARLAIVGEGYLFNNLKAKIEGLGLGDSVLFSGFQLNVADIIATFDVAVLPSFFEGMGRVLLEAMAMEKPVVASKVGGIPDLVKHGVNGFLVDAGDVEGLFEAIARLLSDKKLAKEMGMAGRRMITNKFSAEVMVESIKKVYSECLKEKGILIGN